MTTLPPASQSPSPESPSPETPAPEPPAPESIASSSSRPRKTVEDLLSLPEATRSELIDGEIYHLPRPLLPHQRVVRDVLRLLEAWAAASGAGEVIPGPIDVHLPTGDVVAPDVVFVAKANAGILADAIRGVPDLVVEVVSAERPYRDRIVKRDVLAHAGVPEFWVLDPEEEGIEVFRLEAGQYEPAGYFRPGTVLVSPTLPGISIPADDVFRRPKA